MVNGGTTFEHVARSRPARHTITATAYDNAGMDLVRYRTRPARPSVTGNYCHRTAWKNSIQTVTWTVTK